MPYTLEPYKSPASRHRCPSCGAIRQFTRYINTQSLEYLAEHVGRCNREQNCAYHFTPKQYFHDHPEIQTPIPHSQTSLPHSLSPSLTQSVSPNPYSKTQTPNPQTSLHPSLSPSLHQSFPQTPNPQPSPGRPSPHLPVTPSLIPDHIFNSSLSNFKSNHFITYLSSIFDQSTVKKLVNTYLIGTSKTWPGSTVFWQIDFHGNIRDGKIMLYNPSTGRRVKQPYNHITWAHSALKLKDYNLQQCFFGEHLLKLHPTLPVSIVESEKTAIIAYLYYPQFIWLATGGKHGCKWSSPNVSKVLTGRHITLWPDIQAYDGWQTKALELSKTGLQVTISNLLEQVSTNQEKEAGLDIADYLIRFKPTQFTDTTYAPSLSPSLTPSLHLPVSLSLLPLSPCHPVNPWPLATLKSFFNSIQLPSTPIRLNQCSFIHNLPKFISGHLSVLHTHNGNKVFLHYLQRLQLLQQILISTNLDSNNIS